MNPGRLKEISYFPGCSLATSARENNQSMLTFCRQSGIDLVELDDWNCCGSSSAHSVDPEVGSQLPARNLSLAPAGRPLLAACPSCYLRLKITHQKLLKDKDARRAYHSRWGRPFNPELEIIHFFDLLAGMADAGNFGDRLNRLKGLRFVPYYGCMLARPPQLRNERNFHGTMENFLSSLGAEPLPWSHKSRCCGTFLSVSRPDIAARSVRKIMDGAAQAGAECVVTACAMCHLNLEIRSALPGKIPVLHFSELLSLAMGIGGGMGWFRRHLIDPRPLLKSRRLIA
ncbi:MAG: heterodisulfide reductase-related iron-sulfur binding cluster [Desulfobacterales bacterium]|nr:heterodisulfide reductase-related iron-sulfur binding cluster [Desulfobacterales bacterium]